MNDFIPGLDGATPAQDPTVAEACPFVSPADPNEEYARREIAENAAQQLFDDKDPYDASFEAERRLREKYALMLDEMPVKARLLIDRTLRRIFFAARGHKMDVHLLEYLNTCIDEEKDPADGSWPTDPDFYRSTTVEPYKGSADRFMRTIVGMGDLASAQAQPRLGERFMDAFNTAYRRYYTSLEAYKIAYPNEDVPVVDPPSELNWELGRRGNGDNVAALQIAHALAYYRQHPDASVEDMWRSALTSCTVLSTAARIRRETFNKLGLKAITSDFDSWETEGTQDFMRHSSLFVYTDSGLAVPTHLSLSERNDNYCSANLDVQHRDPYEVGHIDRLSSWVIEQSNWRGVDDGQGGLLHEKGTFQEANLQMILGSCAAKTTLFPALIRTMRQ